MLLRSCLHGTRALILGEDDAHEAITDLRLGDEARIHLHQVSIHADEAALDIGEHIADEGGILLSRLQGGEASAVRGA